MLHLRRNYGIISQNFGELWKSGREDSGRFWRNCEQGEIVNRISQHPLEVPQNPSSNTQVVELILPLFFPNVFQNLQKCFPIFIKFILYIFRKIFYFIWRCKGYLSEEAKFLEPVSSTPLMRGPLYRNFTSILLLSNFRPQK